MRILVTGASGFVGRAVVRQLRERDASVVAIPHRWSGPSELAQAAGEGPIDACVHLGWYAGAPDYLVNVRENRRSLDDSLDLVELLSDRGCARLVVAGTSAEYRFSTGVLVESSEIAPWSVYGAAKAALHQLLSSSLRPPTMSVAWGRIFNITGPGEAPSRLLPHVAHEVLAGRQVALSDGEQFRDFLHVNDVASGLIAAMDAGHDGPVNICSSVGVPLRDVLTALAERLGDPSLLRFGKRPRGTYDADSVVGANATLRGLGWSLAFDLAATLDSVAAYWSKRLGHARDGQDVSSG